MSETLDSRPRRPVSEGKDWWAREAHDPRPSADIRCNHMSHLTFAVAKHLVRNHGIAFVRQVPLPGLKVIHHHEHGIELQHYAYGSWPAEYVQNPWSPAEHPHQPQRPCSTREFIEKLESRR